jgi:hypothetical protein
VRRETGVSWLDAAVNNANVPQTVDTETAIEIHLRITGEEPAVETYRRFEVAYRLIGRERRYTVDDVVAFAKKRFEQAPVRRSGVIYPSPPTRRRYTRRIRRKLDRRGRRSKRIAVARNPARNASASSAPLIHFPPTARAVGVSRRGEFNERLRE